MPSRQDSEGFRVPDQQERARLLSDIRLYIEPWERALGSGSKPSLVHAAQLNQQTADLQGRAVSVGFGGLSHHIAEFVRLFSAGADVSGLRGQLSVVSELVAQAGQTVSASGAPPGPSQNQGGGMAPPRLITVMRPMDAEVASALNQVRSPPVVTAPPPISAPPPVNVPPPISAPPPVPAMGTPARLSPPAPPLQVPQPAEAPRPAPALQLPPTAAPAPQFGVKSMLGLRAFGSGAQPGRSPSSPAPGNAPVLSLPGFGRSSNHPTGSAAPPRFVAPDASGLPALAPDVTGPRAVASRQSEEIKQRLTPERPATRGSRRSAPPRATPGPGLRGRGRPDTSQRTTLWLGIAGFVALLGIGVFGFLILRRPTHPAVDSTGSGRASTTASSGDAVAATSSGTPGSTVELPRERLLADDERFTALLAQVHGHGGKESPELRSLLNDQAALASKALAGKCKDGSPTCKAWSEVRELMVGNRVKPIVKRRRGSDTETTRSQWMAGLKMPGIPVEDDPRVLRVFEFYTENPIGRETFQSMLFRCGAYRDLIQSTLIRYDLPPDLMALVFTESSCEPSAKSGVGAAGLWQFMPETGRAYHLRIVEGTIDERYSPFKSTEAGIRMLSDLRQKLGSWDLVFASYNLGPFGVLARLERAGGDASFWDLVDAGLLPDETANYAPTVEAIALILANLQRLKFAGSQIHSPQLTADLEVPGGTRLGVVARAAATSVIALHSLNLDFSGDVVPLIPGGSIAVQVPKDVVWQARDTIKELLSSKDGADQCVPPSFDWGKQRFTPDMNAACQRRLAAGSVTPSPNPN